MEVLASTDYQTYREIMDDLMQPILSDGLDPDTLKRLYESKTVYLENLRLRCFREMNQDETCHFSERDYDLILKAIASTRDHLRQLILVTVSGTLERRKVS